MEKERKKRYQFIYGSMVLILLLQTMLSVIVPVITYAESKVSPSSIALEEVTINGEQQVELKVKVIAEIAEEAIINVQSSLNIQKVEWADQVPQSSLELTDDAKKIKLAVQEGEAYTSTILVTTAENTAKIAEPIEFHLGTQQLKTTIPATTLNKEESNELQIETSDSSTSTVTENTTSETSSNSQTNSQGSSQSTVTSETPEKQSNEPIDANRANETGTDIRGYFPDGEGTILTEAHLVYMDEKGNILTEPIPADATVRVHYQWEIPEDVRKQIKAGDTFSFKLPDKLKVSFPRAGELKNAEGEVYANYTLDKDGNIQFVFTENTENQSNITGNFFFETEFNIAHIDGPGETTIDFPEEDKLPPIDVDIKPTTNKEIDKKGEFDRTPNPSSVTWTIDINQSMTNMSNPTVTEHWPEGITYKNLKVYKLVMNLDGTVKEVAEELSSDQYTLDSNGNFIIKGDTSDAYRAIYETTIDEDAKPTEGGDIKIQNNATLSDDKGTSLDAQATMTNTYGKMIQKNQSGYDPTNQTFSWSIKYNYGQKTIPQEQAVITDTLGDNLEVIEDSIVLHKISFDKSGKEIVGEALNAPNDYTLEPNPNGNGFIIKFVSDVDLAVKIDYKTMVTEIVSEDRIVNNKVETGTGDKSEDSGTAKQQGVVKHLGEVDYANKLVSWHIEVNKNQYEMNDFILKDTFYPNPGLQLNIVDGQPDFTITDRTTSNRLVAGEDYDLVSIKDDEDNETGFVVTYKNEYAKTDHAFEISYLTKFDITILDPNDLNNNTFFNNAAIEWTDGSNNKQHSDSEVDFKPDYSYSLNARKSGMYNAQTKEITWSIAVNLSDNELEDAFLTDQILDNQKYVAKSLNIYEAHTLKNGTVEKTSDNPVNSDMRVLEEPSVNNNQTVHIDFPSGTKTYLVEFKTSLANNIIDDSSAYDNVADYSNGGQDRNVEGKVSIENGGSFIQKEGEQDPDDPNYVNWHAIINPSQSTLHDVVITDNPSENQVLDENSIRLYETTVAANGTLTVSKDKPLSKGPDYTVEITTDNETGKQKLVVNLLHEIDRAYQMEYRSYIISSTSAATDKVSNKVSIKATGTKTIEDETGTDVIVPVDHSGGNASGKKGAVTIQKTTGDGNTPLAGAAFQIWDETRSKVLREGLVAENGRIKFGGLPQGDYLLVESKVPDGYVADNDLVRGRKITIDDQTSSENATPMVIKNESNKLVLNKVNADGEKLAGSQFKLDYLYTHDVNGAFWQEVPLKINITDENGQIETENLKPGIYRLIETRAPDGYILNRLAQLFIIENNGTIANQTKEIEVVNYQGSATLIKTDEEGISLAGAVFKVINENGEDVQTNLVADETGAVISEGLAPGKYSFVETRAPDGYVLNTNKTDFEISQSAAGKPSTVNASESFVNYQGSAELIKVDKDGNTLAGAEFKVVDESGKDVQTNLISNEDGIVEVAGLAPGSYSFVETKAPDGYLINTSLLKFTILAEASGSVDTVEVGDFVNYKGAFSLTKVNTLDEPLAGAEFQLYNTNKEPLDIKAISGGDGKVTFQDLMPGTYYYKETKAPAVSDGTSYIVNPSLIKIEIPASYEGDPAVLDTGDFQNFKGRVEVTKVGEGSESIAGSKFELYVIENGNETKVRDITVPEDGKLNLDNLGVGNYKLIEVEATQSYLINAQPVYFVVNENDDENEVIDILDFPNYQQEIEGKKVNASGNPLAQAVYQIYAADENNQPQGEPIQVSDKSDKVITEITTDENGTIYAKGLAVGEYVLVEINAPDGYIRDTKPHPFRVSEQVGKPDLIDLGNFINFQGSATFKKTDSNGKGLTGAVFNVLNMDGKEVQKDLTSDETGQVTIQNLAPGEYSLVETKAPNGYVLNSEPISFTIEAETSGEPATVKVADVVNYQGRVQLTKTDEIGNPLSGAVFKLQTVTGELIKEGLTSDSEGQIIVHDLAPGLYEFIETKSPTGYQLMSKKAKFTIAAMTAGEPDIIEVGPFVNTKIPKFPTYPYLPNSGTTGKLPQTSEEKTNDSMMIVGVVIFLGVSGLIVYRSRKKHKG
ncbi:cell wall surface anchor protein [Enterococcus sp. C1]|uniref:SpaA isopeptide-forming pilin-related protein n=1 Tax=Enterococcus sp. C1 TaxID=1182762 RepID=UPI0002722369|nr:SpaA isopeptide-forming pilin-related protein [Enterococcus sp. C1]EJF47964.1 cell wall surface anchor protein [Enterococcus sp. C1]